MLLGKREMHERAKLGQTVRCMKIIDDGPHLICKPASSIVQSLLKFRAFLLEVCQDRLGCGEHQRMSNERAGEKSHADFWKRLIAVLPLPAVKGIHEFCVACDDADWKAAANDFSVGSQVGAYVEI